MRNVLLIKTKLSTIFSITINPKRIKMIEIEILKEIIRNITRGQNHALKIERSIIEIMMIREIRSIVMMIEIVAEEVEIVIEKKKGDEKLNVN